MNSLKVFAIALAIAGSVLSSQGQSVVSLEGTWRFALDRADVGVAETWFARALPDKIKLPGSLPGQSIGDPITTNRN